MGVRELIECYTADRESIEAFHNVSYSAVRRDKLTQLAEDYRQRLNEVEFERLDQDAKVDWVLFELLLRDTVQQSGRAYERWLQIEPLLPYAAAFLALWHCRQAVERIEGRAAAAAWQSIAEMAQSSLAEVEGHDVQLRIEASRVAAEIIELSSKWRAFYEHFDPEFWWWVGERFDEAIAEIEKHKDALAESQALGGARAGREALLADLASAMVPYTPEELIEIGEKEYARCEAEMIRAAGELGFGDDWRAAVEHVKGFHEPVGNQPYLVRDLAEEAVRFLEERDLMTVPPLSKETWRMEMLTAEQQLTSPFFLGGPTIYVSFPSNEMNLDRKEMSLRGNNRHFSRATVQHELIPGHHTQFFANKRNRPYREVFYTPFWVEGWTLHWEMLLWDLGFAQSPKDRIGMLFWRMHRCARIFFSLRFHLGEMEPQECVDFLVERVGHERANAEAEVRRSFGGEYPPLYQLAYMIGGLQMRALYQEMTEVHGWTPKHFHDAVLQQNYMPLAVLRQVLMGEPILKDFKPMKPRQLGAYS